MSMSEWKKIDEINGELKEQIDDHDKNMEE